MSQLFISDLHLQEERTDITEAFIDFLQTTAAESEALYILGDFFEVWLGDDHHTPFNQKVIDAVAQLHAPKYLMHGNRDFLMGELLCESMGATLLPDPTVIDLYGQPVLLMHGDSLCTQDVAYMNVRKMLREPAFQKDFLTKSIDERDAFAKGARAQSKEHTREKAADIMDVTPMEVTAAMRLAQVKLLIHGHTHRPKVHAVDLGDATGQRIVLGDWDQSGWFLEADAEGCRLKSFSIG